MVIQIALSEEARADEVRETYDLRVIRSDLAYLKTMLVNLVFFGKRQPGDRGWVLVDAGVLGAAPKIIDAAAARFGVGARPAAIIQTHGHFDHLGALEELSAKWDAPVYAHRLELPFLFGGASCPQPDAAADDGVIPKLAPLFPRSPVDVSARLRTLAEDGSVPPMPGWQWLHTPGHTPGHVSLWRLSDRTLIAGALLSPRVRNLSTK